MIELQPLAITDLSMNYARKMEGNKIRHYKVSGLDLYISKLTGKVPDDIVKDYIKQNEGEEAVILPYKKAVWPKDIGKEVVSNNSAIQMRDISEFILEDHPDIERALRKVHVQSQLYQYNEPGPWYEFIWNPFAKVYNFLISPVNRLLAKLQGFNSRWEADPHREMNDDGNGWHMTEQKGYFLPYMLYEGYRRQVTPCQYLSVSFDEDYLEKAVESLTADLKTLNDKGLIMGHLAMPSIILLADTVGSGKSKYAIFCFLFVDYKKLCEITGKTPLDMPRQPLELIGVKNSAYEGGLGPDFSTYYEIEHVYVGSVSSEKNRQAHIDNYLETVEQVNQIAKHAEDTLENLQVVNKDSCNTGFGKVAVTADIIGPNGEGATLGDLYNKNS